MKNEADTPHILDWLVVVEGRAGQRLGSHWFLTLRVTRSDGGQALR